MSRDATAVVAIEPPARGTFGKLLAAVTAKPEGMQPRHLTLEFGVELPEVLQAVSPLLERQLSFEYRPSRGEPDVRYGTSFRYEVSILGMVTSTSRLPTGCTTAPRVGAETREPRPVRREPASDNELRRCRRWGPNPHGARRSSQLSLDGRRRDGGTDTGGDSIDDCSELVLGDHEGR